MALVLYPGQSTAGSEDDICGVDAHDWSTSSSMATAWSMDVFGAPLPFVEVRAFPRADVEYHAEVRLTLGDIDTMWLSAAYIASPGEQFFLDVDPTPEAIVHPELSEHVSDLSVQVVAINGNSGVELTRVSVPTLRAIYAEENQGVVLSWTDEALLVNALAEGAVPNPATGLLDGVDATVPDEDGVSMGAAPRLDF